MKKLYIGTTVKFTTITSVTPTSITITIKDPGCVVLIDSVAMTNETTRVYTYSYQSDVANPYGRYTAIIKATYNGKETLDIIEFDLEQQPGINN